MEKTVMITGGTGYLGSWVVKGLLEKGYTVRLTVRDKNKPVKYRHLQDIEKQSMGKLELWEANLLKERSYDEAASGSDAVIHMASPFNLNVKDPKKELIEPAIEGTRNVLESANRSKTVKRVVLTSSVAAVHGDSIELEEYGLEEFTEEHFNETSSEEHQPYSYSKVLAEKEAWKIHDAQRDWKLVVINPSFVMGPSLTEASDSESIHFMKNLLSGKFAMGVPELYYGFVDVRDVAEAHIEALENEKAEGRHILAERTASLMELVDIIRNLYGKKYKLPRRSTPKYLLYLLGWMFGLKKKFIRRNVGYPLKLNTKKSRKALGISYTPLEETVRDMVEWMEEKGLA